MEVYEKDEKGIWVLLGWREGEGEDIFVGELRDIVKKWEYRERKGV